MLPTRYAPVRLAWLIGSFVVVAIGVSLLLASRLGTDGYTALVNGLTIRSGWAFAAMSVVVALVFIATAWLGGLRPDIGTVLQPVVVGVVVGALMPFMPAPTGAEAWALFAVGFLVISVGVAAYLAADLGIGPTESPAIAFDPPLPFRWSYLCIQVSGCGVGWLCGADVGIGTLVVVFGISPVVDRLRPVMPHWA